MRRSWPTSLSLVVQTLTIRHAARHRTGRPDLPVLLRDVDRTQALSSVGLLPSYALLGLTPGRRGGHRVFPSRSSPGWFFGFLPILRNHRRSRKRK